MSSLFYLYHTHGSQDTDDGGGDQEFVESEGFLFHKSILTKFIIKINKKLITRVSLTFYFYLSAVNVVVSYLNLNTDRFS